MRWHGLPRAVSLALASGLLASSPARAEVRSVQVVRAELDLAGDLLASREATWVSAPFDAGIAFSAIGPHWRGAPGVALELSVSPDGVRWGGWIAVPREGTIEEKREDGEPNPFAGEAVGALVFVAPGSRWARFRARLPALPRGEVALRTISFHVIDPGPAIRGAPPPSPHARGPALDVPDPQGVSGTSARRATAPPPEVPVRVPPLARPPVSRRAAWGARPPRAAYAYTLARHVGIHHTATVEDFSAQTWEECAARMRSIQAFHMETNGWNDIGYAWAICRHGDVFQAREDDDDATDVWGAHDGWNRGSTGITVFGYFHPPVNHQPTDAQISALTDLVAWIASLREIDPLGRSLYEAFGAPVDNVYGHREVKATDCPGDHLFALKELIRRSASEKALRQVY